MTVEPDEQIKILFGDALELPDSQRNAFVISATEDREVQRRVLRMLDEERRLGDFLSPLAIVVDQSGAESPAVPRAFDDGQAVADRYRIERLISAGGMGEVYEAYDLKLEQRIALKTILPRLAGDSQAMGRFRREVAVARSVTHPNVCRVFDFGEHRGPGGQVSFLTMQFLPGETLAERLERRGKLPAQEALPLLRQMAEALDAAHRAGVIHRDFKPGNVMLVPDGESGERAVVTDFGLARTVAGKVGEATLTQVGQIMGTPDYMAPEQWTGEETSPATDVYALGVVLHEMLVGRRPGLSGADASELDPRWKETIDQCLEKAPGSRPRSAGEVAAALDGQAGGATADALDSPRLWNIRPWGIAAILVCLALIVLLLRLPFREDITAQPGQKRVAVLPFQVGDEELQVFADGLMESITHRLSQYEGFNEALLVTPASETRRQDVTTAGDAQSKFGVDYAVEGSLQGQDGRLRLLLTVVDVASMTQLESAIVEGTRQTALSLQDEAVAKLVNALGLGVKPEHAAELNEFSPVEPAAYDFYLQARGYLQRGDRLSDVDNAIALLARALELDNSYAPAHAALCEARWRKYEHTAQSPLVDQAVQACNTALDLNPNLAEVHVTFGRLLTGQGKYLIAIQEFERALEIDSRSAEAYQGLGGAYQGAERFNEAEATYRKAIALRSADWRGYRDLGLFYYRRSQYSKAIEQFEEVRALTPDNPIAYNNIGAFYGLLGDSDQAQRMLERALELEPTRVSTLTNLTKLLFDKGAPDEAVRHWRAAAEANPSSYRLWGNLASAYEKTADSDRARQSYRRAISILDDAIAINPESRELYSYRAHYLAAIGRDEEALLDLNRSKSHEISEIEMLVRDARSFERLGQRRSARTLLRKALALGYPIESAKREAKLNVILNDIVE